MKKFHIVLITPKENSHIKCFTEIIILLKKSIEECGYACSFAHNRFLADSFNIIIGAHLLHPNAIPKGFKIITFQFEQLSDHEGIFNQNLESVLKRSDFVWDYSIDNINFLEKRNIYAQYVPIGYNQILQQIPKQNNKDIDLLFFGSMNERRKKILQKIHLDTNIRTLTLFDVYGQERNNFISRSKLVLNIHFFESQIFESVRISFLLNNNIPFLSEDSKITPYSEINLPVCKANEFSNKINNILKNYEDFLEECNNNHKLFKEKYLMKDIIQNTIKEY